MKDETNYEIEKQLKKQKLVRNEFLNNHKCTSKHNFPIIKKQNVDISKIKFLSCQNIKENDDENKDKTIHFFTYDWLFEKFYQNPDDYVDKLKQYYAILSPDFSLFTNMPKALQIASVFKNRWCGAYYQSKGIKVIPTVSWGDESTFDFCFEGIEEGSIVAVCTYYRENCEEEFMPGYNKMLDVIKPSAIICYDEPFKEMKGDIYSFMPTTYEWTKDLTDEDKIQFMWEKHHRNISGLDKEYFKFFKYDDPYAKKCIKKCSVCDYPVLIDEWGNGTCENCGWNLWDGDKNYPESVSYPNMISLNKAKKYYKNNLPFKPDLNDFIKALNMYSEMEFKYNGVRYEVWKTSNNIISICGGKLNQEYTEAQFVDTVRIEGKSLKEIWPNITDAYYLDCI